MDARLTGSTPRQALSTHSAATGAVAVLPVESNPAVRPGLRVRGPAYAVMVECLRIHASGRPRSRVARLFGASPLSADARGWYRAALGEIEVARLLKNLGDTWRVLRAVAPADGLETGRAASASQPDADCVAIGPAGVFMITTKNHSNQRVWVGDDALLVNGRRTNHIRDARSGASDAARLLSTGVGESVDVTPVIAIVDPGSLTIKSGVDGVIVISASQLGRILSRRRPVLEASDVDATVAAAERTGAWRLDAHVFDDTFRHANRFTRLRTEVEAASRRRIAWLLGAFLMVAGVVTTVLIATVPLAV